MTDIFVKQRPDAPAGFFEAEASGLRWLAVPGGVSVVPVLDVSPGRLALERLTEVEPSARAAERFGRELAVTHAAGAAGFGTPPDGWTGPGFIGTAPLPYANHDGLRWGEFYASLRVAPYARAARDSGLFGPAETALFDRICAHLTDGRYDAGGTVPSRLHGDLWAGNVLWCADGVRLVDPAAHGGHPETDLAMLALFGLPHLHRVLAGYDEAAPLADGWRDRVRLHQLHPLLVHVVLFGERYVDRTLAAARAV
ncbi:MAG: fructosamine kinase family protein [Kribbellaceae bacterium]